MVHWPPDPQAGVPPPALVAAWLVLGTVRADRVPLWAAHWLASGRDGEALAALAGLDGGDPHDVRDLLPAALAECGVVTPDVASAVERTHTALARLHLDGVIGAHLVVRGVLDVVESTDGPAAVEPPMGELYLLDDEWEAGWGRTRDELSAVVRAACLAQLRATGP